MPPLSRKISPAPPTELEWVEASVGLTTTKGTTIGVEAWVLGVVAVHEALAPDKGWTVTAVPSGMVLAIFSNRMAAKQFAEVLVELRVPGLNLSNPGRAVAAVPDRIKNWIRACRRHDRVVEPTPVMEGV